MFLTNIFLNIYVTDNEKENLKYMVIQQSE